MNKFLLLMFSLGICSNVHTINAHPVTVTTTTKKASEGNKAYRTEYPLGHKQGLVRISSLFFTNEGAQSVLTIKRHAKNTVVVEAVLSKDIVKKRDKSEIDTFYKERGLIWTPWWDDTNSSSGERFALKHKAQLQGTNRLKVELREQGHYIVTVPKDADLEVDADVGLIRHESTLPTRLNIESKSVNVPGSSGSGTAEGQSWTYYWGDESDPVTSLKTKNGRIELATETRPLPDIAHYLTWKHFAGRRD